MSTGRAEEEGEGEEDEGEARTEVPTPPDRPAEVEEAREAPRSAARDSVSDTTTDAGETACRARLAAAPLVWEEVDPIREGRCGIAAPVRVTRAAGLDLTPAATLNCRTAEALALWLRDDVTPAARRHLGADPTDVRIGSAYVCRNRNGRASGKLSEHAFGNAVDVGGFVVDGDEVPVVSRDHKSAPRRVAFQREIRRAACNRFTTVLGPGTDGSHSDHFHLDLRDRRRGYRLCQ